MSTAEQERKDFVVPPATGTYEGFDLALLDRENEDDRRVLIEAEHPELHSALRRGAEEVHVAGTAMNPRLHITMHEVTANQLWADDPPEVWETAQRLTAAGYARHEVLHMLASVNSSMVHAALSDETPFDPGRMRAMLAALPESWEEQRAETSESAPRNRAERRAAARRRRH